MIFCFFLQISFVLLEFPSYFPQNLFPSNFLHLAKNFLSKGNFLQSGSAASRLPKDTETYDLLSTDSEQGCINVFFTRALIEGGEGGVYATELSSGTFKY